MHEASLREDVKVTLNRLTTKHQGLKKKLDGAYGYAVFPSVGRASAVVGVSAGDGQVFKAGKSVGFANLRQLTIGLQLGGQTYSEILLFNDSGSFKEFKKGKVHFAANASAVLVKAAATVTNDFNGVNALAYGEGGELLELSLGGQKFNFQPPSKRNGKGKGNGKGSSSEEGGERSDVKSKLARAKEDPRGELKGMTSRAGERLEELRSGEGVERLGEFGSRLGSKFSALLEERDGEGILVRAATKLEDGIQRVGDRVKAVIASSSEEDELEDEGEDDEEEDEDDEDEDDEDEDDEDEDDEDDDDEDDDDEDEDDEDDEDDDEPSPKKSPPKKSSAKKSPSKKSSPKKSPSKKSPSKKSSSAGAKSKARGGG